jgi:hypothetical protein
MGFKVGERKDKPGWWVFINHNGQRRKKSFGSNKKLAQEFAAKVEAKIKLGGAGITSNRSVKLEDYASIWLERIRHTRKLSTYQDYAGMLKRDLLPAMHGMDLGSITRDRVKALATASLKRG